MEKEVDEQKDEKEATEKTESNTKANPKEGDKSKEYDFIDRTNAAAKRLENATEAAAEERTAGEKLLAEQKLGGGSGAANPVKEPKEETPAEYKDRVMSGNLSQDGGKN